MRDKSVSKTRSATWLRQKEQNRRNIKKAKTKIKSKGIKNVCLTKGMSGKMN